jgi:hypothetical protein
MVMIILPVSSINNYYLTNYSHSNHCVTQFNVSAIQLKEITLLRNISPPYQPFPANLNDPLLSLYCGIFSPRYSYNAWRFFLCSKIL